MDDKAIRKYCRCVSKLLCCRSDTKKRLLAGLQQELAENDLSNLSYDQLSSRFGTPDAVAAQLMEAVEPEEAAREARRRKTRLFCIVAGILAVVIIATALYIHHLAHHAIAYYVEETIETVSEHHY